MPSASAGRASPGFVLAALAVALAPAGMAAAQGAEGAAPRRGETVMERSRPEVDPLGVRLGAFRLDAAALVGAGYDDNLFGTNRARRGDAFLETALRAGIASDWSTHALSLRAGVTDRRYAAEDNLDWTDWDVAAAGRLDIATDVALDAGYAHRRQHLEARSVDVQQAGIVESVPYDVDAFALGGNWRLNRVALGLSGTYELYRYQDVDSASGGRVSANDYDTLTLRADAGYEFVPGRSVTLGLRWQDVAYADVAARDRNSGTWSVLAGFRYDFDGIWRARIAVGYARREYDGPGFKPLEIPAFEADVTWNATQITTLTLTASRTIRESIRTGSAGYVSTLGQVRVDHELYRNVVVSAVAGLAGQEYQDPDQRAVDAVLGASALWLVNRMFALTLDYRYVNRVSRSGGLESYDENTAFLRLRVGL